MWLIILGLLLILAFEYLWKSHQNAKLQTIKGPISLPLIGSIWVFYNRKSDELFESALQIREKYGRTAKMWIFHIQAMLTSELEFVQEILGHSTEIRKNRMYNLLVEWLGEGLLISYGTKWLGRRRAITPTFHFNILEDFIGVMDRQAQILAKKFEKHAGNNEAFDIHHYVALATLDVICESAMGVRIDAQTNEHSEYVQLLTEMVNIILHRFTIFAYRSDILFKLFAPKLAKRQLFIQNALHSFTERIIMERRQEILEGKTKLLEQKADDFGIKKRMALLDVLLSSTIDGKPLTNVDIREEVDTFMFEGHDTTKSAIGFTLYCISREPEVQTKLYEEIKAVIGTDTNQEINYRQLMELKYLDKVIRESLRMYPPVPFIGRAITKDCNINSSLISNKLLLSLSIGVTVATGFGYWCYKTYKQNQIPKKWRRVGTLAELYLFPLKSCGAIKIETEARCEVLGLLRDGILDRSLVLLDKLDGIVTGRTYSKMIVIKCEIIAPGVLRVSAENMPTLNIDFGKLSEEKPTIVRTSVFGSKLDVALCGQEYDQWFSQVILGKPEGLRLARFHHDVPVRDVPNDMKHERFIKRKDTGAIGDATSYMLMNLSSVEDLNKRLANAVFPIQFRGNFYLKMDNHQPYAEDKWSWIKIGEDAVFRNVAPCTRCIMPNINPLNGQRDADTEPQRTLKTYRKVPNYKSPQLGIHMGLRRFGVVKPNDVIYVAEEES